MAQLAENLAAGGAIAWHLDAEGWFIPGRDELIRQLPPFEAIPREDGIVFRAKNAKIEHGGELHR